MAAKKLLDIPSPINQYDPAWWKKYATGKIDYVGMDRESEYLPYGDLQVRYGDYLMEINAGGDIVGTRKRPVRQESIEARIYKLDARGNYVFTKNPKLGTSDAFIYRKGVDYTAKTTAQALRDRAIRKAQAEKLLGIMQEVFIKTVQGRQVGGFLAGMF